VPRSRPDPVEVRPIGATRVGASWHPDQVAAQRSVFGRSILIIGPEALLADRAVDGVVVRARAEDPDVEIAEANALRLDPAVLVELTGQSLFSTRRVTVLSDVADLAPDVAGALAQLAEEPLPDLSVVLVHRGSPKGKMLLDRLAAAGVETIECAPLKPWELPEFVAGEARRPGGSIDRPAAQLLVDSVGQDLRALASAVSQLLADSETGQITVDQVRRYFGGRAEVTSFAVADAALSGRTGEAMEQLRWALTTGVAPVLITSALASGLRSIGKLITAGTGLRDADLAKEVGVPPWKLKSIRSQARGWDPAGVAHALRVAADADADVKGAAEDSAFSLEQAVLAVSRCRRG
jgi:DNA polymerase III subunit delta